MRTAEDRANGAELTVREKGKTDGERRTCIELARGMKEAMWKLT
jgi:hypothetical protein